ncbi:MAG TPA: hypothetical protein VMU26_27675 [Candidatus Polarisedimenticolia bacterium]|nr:hypothetical protein [Candidatus Polarisedimenticolia bacterium]
MAARTLAIFSEPLVLPGDRSWAASASPSSSKRDHGCSRSSVNAVVGIATNDYIPHHCFFSDYASTSNPAHTRPAIDAEIGKAGRADHQCDIEDFYTGAAQAKLPAGSFLKAPAYQDGHDGYSDPISDLIDEQTFLINPINHQFPANPALRVQHRRGYHVRRLRLMV